MTTDKDSRLVDYLYDELSDEEAEAFERALESDEALSSELTGLEETLQTLRTVEAEDPPPHLDSLILAHAREAAEEQKKQGWFRKLFASPVAGLVAAASVAMIAAIVAVPSMMLTTSEEAPRAVEQIPTPVTLSEPTPEAERAAEPVDEIEEDLEAAHAEDAPSPKKKARRRPAIGKRSAQRAERAETGGRASPDRGPSVAAARRPEPDAPPAPKPAPIKKEAIAKEEKKVDTAFAFEDRLGAEGRAKDAKTSAAPGPAKPPAPPAEPSRTPPAQPQAQALRQEEQAEKSEELVVERETKSLETRRLSASDATKKNDEAMREERGRSMLSAASAEFKRGNSEGGRQILVRALSLVGAAPVHAEIAFRLAQHDLARGAYGEALYYARIAASAAKFDKRKAALELMVEAEKRLAEKPAAGADIDLAPATSPPADADEAR